MSKVIKIGIIIVVELTILLGCANIALKSEGSSLDKVFSDLSVRNSTIIKIAYSTLVKDDSPEEYAKSQGMVFDAEPYLYYRALSECEKSLYRQIYMNVCEYDSEIVPVVSIDVEEADRAVQAVILDHPELFWIGTRYTCMYTPNRKCLSISMEYLFDSDSIDIAKKQFNSKVNEIIQGAMQFSDPYSQEKYVHDAILDLVDYNGIDIFAGQNAYSALVNRSSVCAGYSRAFQCIMTELGIPTYYCMGTADGDHAWNIIKLSDGYYNVDLTWDDACYNRYEYFNRNGEEFDASHIRDSESMILPSCDGSIWTGPQISATIEIPYIEIYPTPEPPSYIETR